MSDLKYKNAAQLKKIIESDEAYLRKLNEKLIPIEEQIEVLQKQASPLHLKRHNIEIRIEWAKKYLEQAADDENYKIFT